MGRFVKYRKFVEDLTILNSFDFIQKQIKHYDNERKKLYYSLIGYYILYSYKTRTKKFAFVLEYRKKTDEITVHSKNKISLIVGSFVKLYGVYKEKV